MLAPVGDNMVSHSGGSDFPGSQDVMHAASPSEHVDSTGGVPSTQPPSFQDNPQMSADKRQSITRKRVPPTALLRNSQNELEKNTKLRQELIEMLPTLSEPGAKTISAHIETLNKVIETNKKQIAMDEQHIKNRAEHDEFVEKFEAMKLKFQQEENAWRASKPSQSSKGKQPAAHPWSSNRPSSLEIKTTFDKNYAAWKAEKAQNEQSLGAEQEHPEPCSRRSSINSDNYDGENAVIETATFKAMPIRSIAPSELKIVDIKKPKSKMVQIPPRTSSREKPPALLPDGTSSGLSESIHITESFANPYADHEEDIVNNSLNTHDRNSTGKKHHCLRDGHPYLRVPSDATTTDGKDKIRCEVCGSQVKVSDVRQCVIPVCKREICPQCEKREEVKKLEKAKQAWL